MPATTSSRSTAPEPATRTIAGHFFGASPVAGGAGREIVAARLNPLAGIFASSSPARVIFSCRVAIDATSSRATSSSTEGMRIRTSVPSSSVQISTASGPLEFLNVTSCRRTSKERIGVFSRSLFTPSSVASTSACGATYARNVAPGFMPTSCLPSATYDAYKLFGSRTAPGLSVSVLLDDWVP